MNKRISARLNRVARQLSASHPDDLLESAASAVSRLSDALKKYSDADEFGRSHPAALGDLAALVKIVKASARELEGLQEKLEEVVKY